MENGEDEMNIRIATMDDLDAIAAMEAQCFRNEEAATRSTFEKRLAVFPNHFWLLEVDEEIVSGINGMTTNTPMLRDEMYVNADLHEETGAWQMIFGVMTLPECQGQGYASKLMEQVIKDCREQGRKGIVLTCKDEFINFYIKFGFINEGMSISKHGGVSWNEMRLSFIEL